MKGLLQVSKYLLSDNNRKTLNQQQRETGKLPNVFSSYNLLLFFVPDLLNLSLSSLAYLY